MERFKKILALVLSVCVMWGMVPGIVSALPGGGYLPVQDFEDFFSTEDMLTEIFSGKIGVDPNVVGKGEFVKNGGYNGSGALMLQGLCTEDKPTKGGMIQATMIVPSSKTDWTGGEYLQFWAKNNSDQSFGLRIELRDSANTPYDLGSVPVPVLYETRPGEGVFNTQKSSGSKRVPIMAGFEGIVKVPLSYFIGLNDYSGIAKIYLGISVMTVPDIPLYLDNFAVVNSSYQDPVEKVYPPTLSNNLIRLNYETMQARYSCNVTTRSENKNIVLTIKNPSGEVLVNKTITPDENGKVTYYYDLPENASSGTYPLTACPEGYNEGYKSSFTYIERQPSSFADVENTAYERAVYILSNLGIITGYEDNTFRPQSEITRAEFTALLVRVLAMTDAAKAKASAPFNDTDGHWSAGNIAVGAEQGLINGYGDGRFGPNDSVTYEQAVKMLVAALGYDDDAIAAGGYPKGYLETGEKIGVTKDIKVTDNRAVRGTVALLLQNTIRSTIKGTGTNLAMENFEDGMDKLRLQTVVEFGDNVLTYGRDYYGEKHTPLLADGLNVYTLEPVVWIYNGKLSVLSNFSSQQNLLRTLDGLTSLTGDTKYKETAVEQIKYQFENNSDSTGVLYAGGHAWLDLNTDDYSHGKVEALEFKAVYPHYELWHEVDAENTEKFIKGLWNSLVTDWSILEITRHGTYNKSMGALWNSAWNNPEPFQELPGLSFFLSGTDLFYGAMKLYEWNKDEGARLWSERLIDLYMRARHPETKLGGMQHSLAKRSKELPADWQENYITEYSWSQYGDRARNQFGPEFGDIAIEPWVIYSADTTLYGAFQLLSSEIYDNVGDAAKKFVNWSVECAEAYAKYGYDAETDKSNMMFADGTIISGYELPRSGYYGLKGVKLAQKPQPAATFAGFASAYRQSKSQIIWDTMCKMAKNHDLGYLGTAAGENLNLNFATTEDSGEMLFGILELYRMTGNKDYLRLAKAMGNNIVFDGYTKGFYLCPNDDVHDVVDYTQFTRTRTKFDGYEPLALLNVEAYNRGTPDLVPKYNSGEGYVADAHDGINSEAPGELRVLYSGRFDAEY
jgi:pectate lyase